MNPRGPRLLLVDDDATTLRALSRILSAYGDQRLATSGAQALHLARAEPPDLMLIDMEMPGMSGTQLCALLKSDPMLADVPVLFVTSDDTQETRVEALQLGAADFVIKPFLSEQLQARVAAILRNAERLKQSKQEVAQASPAAASLLHSGPFRLMAVDDDEGAIEMLRHTLSGVGEVRAVQQGRDAMDMARSWQPDLVLIDALMSGMDGFELCSRLQADPQLRQVPIVFVTRLANFQYEAKALALGATDFVIKPYSPPILKARVRNLLELKRRSDIELATAATQGQRLTSERQAAVIEGASDAIVTINAEGLIVLMNAAAGRMLQLDPQRTPGMPAAALLAPRLPGLPLTQATASRRVLVSRDDGAALPAEVSVSHVGDGSMRLTTLMLRDLSDRERLQAEASARAAAEASNRTKALMISYVAHEIDNPLKCILGFTQALRSDATAPLNDTQAHRLQMIEAGCVQLTALMKDLTDLGHYELGRLVITPQPVRAADVVNEALRAAAALADQVEVRLDCAPVEADQHWVLADANRLRQCLINLLSNGIKYNRRGGQVSVTLRTLDDCLEIAISDTGTGMTDLQMQHLFEPFNRLGRDDTKVPGTGLGLVVTRQLIEAMGGHLEVSSQPGQGSRFAVILHRAPALPTQAASA